MWNLRKKINEQRRGEKRDKPRNRLLTIENKQDYWREGGWGGGDELNR